MKRIIIAFLALVLAVPLISQEGDNSKEDFVRGLNKSIELAAGLQYESFYTKPGWNANMNFVIGYQFNPHISAGVGTGWHYYDIYSHVSVYPDGDYNIKHKSHLLPLFLDCKINILNKGFSPYLSLRAGYAFILEDENDFFVNPALGITTKVSDKIFVDLSIDLEGHISTWGAPFGLDVGISYVL